MTVSVNNEEHEAKVQFKYSQSRKIVWLL